MSLTVRIIQKLIKRHKRKLFLALTFLWEQEFIKDKEFEKIDKRITKRYLLLLD